MNQSMHRPSRILVISAFLAIYIIWGTTYLAIRYGLLGMKPFVLNTLRYGLAAIILFAWCGARKLKLPNKQNTKVLIVSGLLMLVGGTSLVVTGEQYINSGATATIIATEPLMFLLLDKKNYRSYSPAIFIGMVLGFTGIYIFSHFAAQTTDALSIGAVNIVKGTVLVLISALFWVLGTLQLSRLRDNDAAPLSNAAWAGLTWLLFMGTLVAFLAFMFLVRVQPPAIVSTHTYVNPIVAVIAGWLFAGESIAGPQLLALGMVLLGVLLVQSPRMKRLNLFARNPTRTRTGAPATDATRAAISDK
jgi:drug/metabolite transporter (DMT)-like permease